MGILYYQYELEEKSRVETKEGIPSF